MTVWAQGIHEDQNGIKTAASYDDIGDGTDNWFQWVRVADGGDAALGALADAAVEGGATNGSVIALLKGLQKALGVSTDASAPSGNGYVIALLKAIRDTLRLRRPGDSTFVSAAANGANSIAAATMPATASVTNYLTGVEVTGLGATAAGNANLVISGLSGGSRTFMIDVPAGITVGIVPLILRFDPPIPASAANTAIVATLSAFGAGNTTALVNVHGYRV